MVGKIFCYSTYAVELRNLNLNRNVVVQGNKIEYTIGKLIVKFFNPVKSKYLGWLQVKVTAQCQNTYRMTKLGKHVVYNNFSGHCLIVLTCCFHELSKIN